MKITRVEYPVGVAGVHLSLTEIAGRIREGGRTPSIRAFAEMVVRQKVPPAQHTSAKQAAEILLEYIVDNVRYRADPPMTEWTQSANVTLCVNGAPMCIPVGDCDDLIVALGSLLMAYGIPVRVVKQTFGYGDQEHVLIEFQDEGGSWIAADPTPRSPSMPVGQKAIATHEDYINPLDPSAIGMVAGTPDAEFIGVGKMDRQKSVTRRGVGVITANSYSQASVDLANQVVAVIAAGDIYMNASPAELTQAVSSYQAAGNAGATSVGPEIDAAGSPFTSAFTQQAWTLNAALAAVNATTPAMIDARIAQSYAKQMSALYTQAIALGSNPPKTGPKSVFGPSPMTVIIGGGIAAGLAYALVTRGNRRGKR